MKPTIDSIPTGWCKKLEILIVDGNSTDKTRELALNKGARVHLEDRRVMVEHTVLDLTLQAMKSLLQWMLIAHTC